MQPGGGLVVMSDGFVRVHRHTIIAATARHKIPTVYPLRLNAADGGLLAYGSYYVDLRPPPLALLMERTKKGQACRWRARFARDKHPPIQFFK